MYHFQQFHTVEQDSEKICTVSILIAAPAPISAHPSYFDVVNYKIINNLPRSIYNKLTYVQYDWE